MTVRSWAKRPSHVVALGVCLVLLSVFAVATQLANRTQSAYAEAQAEFVPSSGAIIEYSLRLFDDFERDQPGQLVGRYSNGMTWSTLGDGFNVSGGLATPSSESQGLATISLVDPGVSDFQSGLTVESVAPGSGLAFRFVDLNNYWSVVAVPEFATWNLAVVRDGAVAMSWPAGLSDMDAGTQVTVHALGPVIELYVDGDLRVIVEDSTHIDATSIGIVGFTGSDAAFSDFYVDLGEPGLVTG